MSSPTYNDLVSMVCKIIDERGWNQESPKDLATALIVETAELLELFQWLNIGDAAELGEEKIQAVEHEMADVFIYLIAMARKLNIDLLDSTFKKIQLVQNKYPRKF